MMLSINSSWAKDVDENVKRTEKLCGRLDFIATVGFGNCDQATWVLSKTAMLSFLTNCLNPSHTFSVWAEYNLAQPYLIAVNRWKTSAVTDCCYPTLPSKADLPHCNTQFPIKSEVTILNRQNAQMPVFGVGPVLCCTHKKPKNSQQSFNYFLPLEVIILQSMEEVGDTVVLYEW